MAGISVRRLNMDTSWEIHWADRKVIIDPWLVGSEVDYFSWFNEQWHTTEAVSPKEIERPDFILISQSYSDHCHEETLQCFDIDIPILASPKAFNRLSKTFDKSRLIQLPIISENGFLEIDGFQIATIHPGRWIDPVYYAHIIARNGKAIFYSSHGFELNQRQLDLLAELDVQLLITSFSHIKLPFFLGGNVNPGMENVKSLIDQLSPKNVTCSHDEEKEHRGVVMKLAKTSYPDSSAIQFEKSNFIEFSDYQYKEIK